MIHRGTMLVSRHTINIENKLFKNTTNTLHMDSMFESTSVSVLSCVFQWQVISSQLFGRLLV